METETARSASPVVSVIIPMYNAEKYIGECLESILVQTLKNFEVIVVDDCSTDNSAAIVQSCLGRFGGRLTFSSMKKNSGSGAMPRNKGLRFSRGEYVFFMDADDMITETGLEELYTLAKNYDADVVYCEKNYAMNADGSNLFGVYNHENTVDNPTLESENLAERVHGILTGRYWVTPWVKLVRRNLLIEHEIKFPHCVISEDDIWTYALVLYAKNFLRVPNVMYIQRLNENSVIQRKKTPQQTINFWINPIIFGLGSLNELLSNIEFFKENPQYRYSVFEYFISSKLSAAFDLSGFNPSDVVYDTVKQEFADKLGENDILIPALFAYINTLRKEKVENFQRINQFAEQAKARIKELEAELAKRN